MFEQVIIHLRKTYIIVIFSAIVLLLNTADMSDRTCEITECFVEASLDSGRYGNVYRKEIRLDDLENLRFISVANASFFRILYSPNQVSNWYYSTTFPLSHATKIHKVFKMPDTHEISLSQVKGPIIVEANVVTNFTGCIELDLIDSQGRTDTRCIPSGGTTSSYMLIVIYLLFPSLIIWIIIIANLRNRQIVIYEIVPHWFRETIDKRGITCIEARKNYWLYCYLPVSLLASLIGYQANKTSFYSDNSVRSRLKNIALLSIKGYLTVHRPKIVITFIDNSAFFLRCAKMNPDIEFLIVQNGFRSASEIRTIFGGMSDFFSLNNVEYLCYSGRQKKLFEVTLGLGEENILKPFGSTIWKHLRSQHLQIMEPEKKSNDISFVSQWADFHSNELINVTEDQAAAKQNLVIITNALRTLKEKGVNIKIILRTNSEAEKFFFRHKISSDIVMVDMSIDRSNNYLAAFTSKNLLAMSSSLAIEAELYGVDVLMLNPVSSIYFDTSYLVNNYLEDASEADVVDEILIAISRSQSRLINKELVSEMNLIDLIDYKIGI